MNEWINKTYYIFTLEYNSALKRNKVLLYIYHNMDEPQNEMK